MKKLLLLLSHLFLLMSCGNNEEGKPVTSLDAGRAFIRASLDGNFKSAEQLILKDTQNLQLFDSYKSYFHRLSDDKKKKYKAASYIINSYVDENDSTTIINYSNSYMNKPMDIKVIRTNKEWLIDFKYTYSGNLPID